GGGGVGGRRVGFFFSSRRRHTRSKRDWSSDVCSADLGLIHSKSTALSGVSTIASSAPALIIQYAKALMFTDLPDIGRPCSSVWEALARSRQNSGPVSVPGWPRARPSGIWAQVVSAGEVNWGMSRSKGKGIISANVGGSAVMIWHLWALGSMSTYQPGEPTTFSATSVSLSSWREGMYVFGSSSTNPPPRRDEACTSHGLTDRALATAPRHRTTSGSSFSRTAWDRCGSKR